MCSRSKAISKRTAPPWSVPVRARKEVRTAEDLRSVDGLIIPGGESTSMLKLLDYENLFEPLRQFGSEKPIFGTCAGAILLATEVLNPAQTSLGLLDMTIERNGYGRQIDSRIAKIDVADMGEAEAVFIRAPIIRRIGVQAKVLASYLDAPVLVEQGKHMAATFHPELSKPGGRIHELFVRKVKSCPDCRAAGDEVRKVLFLCVGNSCRSQMAEGFARKYGSDVMEAASAGLSPAPIIQTLTRKVMEEKNIRLDDHFAKSLDAVNLPSFDLIVNMSGMKLPRKMPIEVREWKVEDPIGKAEEVYMAVRDQIEMAVMRLILEFRRAEKSNEQAADGVLRRATRPPK